MNQDNWLPFENVFQQIGNHVKFEVMMQDDSIHKAYFDENYYRTAFMVQGTDGMFWRSLSSAPDATPVKWRKLT